MPAKMSAVPKDQSESVSLTLRMPPALQNEVIRRAAVEDRNVSNFVCHWLERTFNEFEVVRQPVKKSTLGVGLLGTPIPIPIASHPKRPKPRTTKKPAKKPRKK